MDAAVGELKPGTRLLGYNVLGLLAQGGMAEVYLALKAGAPPVVIKRIRPNLVEDPQFVRMFLDEARLAKLLSHPNIVKVLEVGEDSRNYALVMEFLDGRNLLRVARACYQRRAYVPYELMGRIMADSLSGLEAAHAQKGSDGKPLNLVHRDMSPENIVITYGGGVKVVDFGIAKAANMEGRTQVGVIKGKLGYVAPEAIQGEKLDGRADIFAMGVTLYELMTYTVPFAGANEVEILTAISTRDPPPPRTLNPSVPPALEDICLKALEKNRARRFQSAVEMRGACEAFVRSTGKGTTQQHLSAFMETLFPKGSDKDRIRVAQLLMDSDSSSTQITAPPTAPPPPLPSPPVAAPTARGMPAPKRAPRKGTPPPAARSPVGADAERNAADFVDVKTKRSGPAWSKSLQIEAMMDQRAQSAPSMPVARVPMRPAGPATAKSGFEAGAGPIGESVKRRIPSDRDEEIPTESFEVGSTDLDDLRAAADGFDPGGEVFDEDFKAEADDDATRIEQSPEMRAALLGNSDDGLARPPHDDAQMLPEGGTPTLENEISISIRSRLSMAPPPLPGPAEPPPTMQVRGPAPPPPPPPTVQLRPPPPPPPSRASAPPPPAPPATPPPTVPAAGVRPPPPPAADPPPKPGAWPATPQATAAQLVLMDAYPVDIEPIAPPPPPIAAWPAPPIEMGAPAVFPHVHSDVTEEDSPSPRGLTRLQSMFLGMMTAALLSLAVVFGLVFAGTLKLPQGVAAAELKPAPLDEAGGAAPELKPAPADETGGAAPELKPAPADEAALAAPSGT